MAFLPVCGGGKGEVDGSIFLARAVVPKSPPVVERGMFLASVPKARHLQITNQRPISPEQKKPDVSGYPNGHTFRES